MADKLAYFLKVDGIKGESVDAKHKDEIDVLSWSWGVSNPGSEIGKGAGGGRAGKPVSSDFSFTHRVDKASPPLFLSCCNGEHIKEVTLAVRRSAAKLQPEYLKVTMKDVIVTGVTSSGADTSSVPLESVAFSYGKIELTYTVTAPTGKSAGAVKAGWDLRRNMKI